MIAIGIILIILLICIWSGLAAVTTLLETMIKNQTEIIRVLKNK